MFKRFLISFLLVSATLCHASQKEKRVISVLPTPVSIIEQPGDFTLKNGLTIGVSDASLLPAGTYLQSLIRQVVRSTVKVGKGDISLQLVGQENMPNGLSMKKEGAYQLNVHKNGIVVNAASYAGIISAISTIRQLLPAEIEQAKAKSKGVVFSLPAVKIEDAPRLAWRGLMMDASRHFWSKEEVKHVLDMMTLYKLNKFHWHLTDDQGWRMEVKKYPLLTEKGAWRKLNAHDRECINRAAKEDNTDFLLPTEKLKIEKGDTLYGGYYTQQDIKEIVSYATQRGIEVIPEVDMPGHFLAAISQYPDVACTGLIGWGNTFSSPICPGKDAALNFCKDIYKEVFELFPSTFVHLGGDEVEKTNWKKCADCQKRMKDEKLHSEDELQAWFVRDMEKFFNENGKRLIGWDEVGEDGLSKDAVIMWWRSWNPTAVPHATKAGMQVIESPNKYCYFDYQQDKNTLKQILGYDPLSNDLSAEQQRLVMGVQANVWAEWIPSMKRWEYMVFPRIMALSEIAWAEPAAKLNETEFYQAIIPQLKRLDILGVNYRIPDLRGFHNVNAFVNEKILSIECPIPGTEIRYTTDGSIPTKKSLLYQGDLKVTESTTFRIRTFRPDGTPCDVVQTYFKKTPYAEADLQAKPTANGLQATWYDFRGNRCANITTAPINGTYKVDAVSIPEGVKGNIGLVLKGYLNIPADGVYTFALFSDDGSTLTLDGDLFLNNDGAHSPAEVIAQKALKKGLHPMEVRYFDHNGGMLEMYLLNERGEKQVLPKEWLLH